MMNQKEKLALWILAIVNPAVCWSIAYLLWKDPHPDKYHTAMTASLSVIAVVFGFFLMGFLLAR